MAIMENKIYPTIKNSIFLCLLLFGALIGAILLITIFEAIFNFSDDSLLAAILSILTNITAFGIILTVGFKKTKRKFNEVFKFNRVSAFLWIAIIVFTIGFIIVTSEMDNLLCYFLPKPETYNDVYKKTAKQTLIIAIISLGIIPAVGEEMFFRGLILDGLKTNYSKTKAILISAFLFGIVHLNPWQFLLTFTMGLFSAWICIETNSILLSIYIHFFNNTFSTIMLKYKDLIPTSDFNDDLNTSVTFQPLWLDLTGLAILTIGIIMLIKGFKKPKLASNSFCTYLMVLVF
jgi:membrane protease YdiL (CAAX protease family)